MVLSALGASCVVLGGLVAAAAGPLGLAEGSWLAAYLVLVAGVAQYGLGRAPALLGTGPLPRGAGWGLLAVWNLGNASVIVGTLVEARILLDTGAALLTLGLVLAWRRVPHPGAARQPRVLRLVGWAYRGLLLVLLVSIPVGLALAHLPDAR